MEQRIERKKILWAALVMMVGAALLAGPAHSAEGDVPTEPTESPDQGPSDPGPSDPGPSDGAGNSDGQPGGGNDDTGGGSDPGPGGGDDDEDRGGDPGVIIGGPPRNEPGPQPGPGPMPAPEPEPDRDFERPAPTMPSPRPERPERPDRNDRPDRPANQPVRENPIVRNDPPSTRVDTFQNIPTVNAPLESVQPSPSTTRESMTRPGDAAYESGSSIIFKSAEEVPGEENTFGMSVGQQSPQSSMQQVFVGTIVAVDKSKNTVVLKDRYRHSRLFFVDANVAQTLRKGNVVQATYLPGTSKVERLQQIIG